MGPITPPSQQIDSAIDRAVMRKQLEALRKDFDSDSSKRESWRVAVEAKIDAIESTLLEMKTSVRVLIAVVAVVGTALVATARWTISHAVGDALIERGLIRYERTP